MVKRTTSQRIRKVHRYLGIFLGLQFLMWTISGLYFSWTDIDEIHGDYFKKAQEPKSFSDLRGLSDFGEEVYALELREIADEPYFWVNDSQLIHALSGALKSGLTADEALAVAQKNMRDDLKVSAITLLEETDAHHEYRGRSLPAYAISYDSDEQITAYVAVTDGSFQTVRHRDWRWFDFLWMTHTMDYETRDDFNTTLLRAFSLLGLITVMSGFLLWAVSSPTLRKLNKTRKK